jgi:uncharacterized repeat protein (TIGR03843 family)
MDTNTDQPGLLPGASQILTALQNGSIELEGQFLNSSNYTFLGRLAYEGNTMRVVYKPRKGEQPLWDFPIGTLTRREAAAYLVSEWLGWQLVPPCIYRTRKTPLGAGSLQLFIDHDPDHHYFQFSDDEKQLLKPMALFDLLANNADRKGGHIFFDESCHLWGIDHGLCFHVEEKLRTVIWDFAGQEIPRKLLDEVHRLNALLTKDSPHYLELSRLIRAGEIRALRKRCQFFLERPHFPYPPDDRRPFPWPPV